MPLNEWWYENMYKWCHESRRNYIFVNLKATKISKQCVLFWSRVPDGYRKNDQKRAVVWPWLVLELSTVLALTQLGIRQSDWWRAGIRSTNLHIVGEFSTMHGSPASASGLRLQIWASYCIKTKWFMSKSDFSMIYHALWDQRHSGATRIHQCTCAMCLMHWLILVAPLCLRSHYAWCIMLKSDYDIMLNSSPLVLHICLIELDQHWFR